MGEEIPGVAEAFPKDGSLWVGSTATPQRNQEEEKQKRNSMVLAPSACA